MERCQDLRWLLKALFLELTRARGYFSRPLNFANRQEAAAARLLNCQQQTAQPGRGSGVLEVIRHGRLRCRSDCRRCSCGPIVVSSFLSSGLNFMLAVVSL